MLILISCAKTMGEVQSPNLPGLTVPAFDSDARRNAMQLAQMPVEEIAGLLKVNPKIAAQNKLRYLDFSVEGSHGVAALMAYTGIVFKRINPADFKEADFLYAQDHLRITSFLYGLLRPLDAILPYRLEGAAELPLNGGRSMFEFWRGKLTDALIADVMAAGGILCNLASGEMRDLFNWKRVESEVRVITPEFRVNKGGRFSSVVVYTKMMRGEMTRHIIKNHISDPEQLKDFHSEEGFRYNPELSTDNRPFMTV